jgi:hypothetical protein
MYLLISYEKVLVGDVALSQVKMRQLDEKYTPNELDEQT